MSEITVDKVLDMYTDVHVANVFIEAHKELIKKILSYRNVPNIRLSVRSMGEEIMGKEKYNAPHVYSSGLEANYRNDEAVHMTGVLTQIFRKLCKMGVMKQNVYRDKEHPVQIEAYGYHYVNEKGETVEDYVDATLADGKVVSVPAHYVSGYKQVYGNYTMTVYPKNSFYTFL